MEILLFVLYLFTSILSAQEIRYDAPAHDEHTHIILDDQAPESNRRLVYGVENPQYPIAYPKGTPVFQGQAKIITDQGSLFTFGLSSCYGIVLHDADSRVAALGHVDTPYKAVSLLHVIESMEVLGANTQTMTMDIIGGDGNTVSVVSFNIIKQIAESRGITIRETHIGLYPERPLAISFDLDDQEVAGYSGDLEGILSRKEEREMDRATRYTWNAFQRGKEHDRLDISIVKHTK